MFLAEISPIELFAAQFGVLGVALFIAGYVLKNCFNRWLSASEREQERKLKSLEAAHMKQLELLNKRDEIRFSKLHETRAEIIALLYNKLVETHSSVEECYDLFENDPTHTKLKNAKEAVNRGEDLSEFILRNKIYFDTVLSEELAELSTCLIDAAIFYEMFCKESQKESKIDEFKSLLGEVKVDIEGSLRETEKQFRGLLGVDETKRQTT